MKQVRELNDIPEEKTLKLLNRTLLWRKFTFQSLDCSTFFLKSLNADNTRASQSFAN